MGRSEEEDKAVREEQENKLVLSTLPKTWIFDLDGTLVKHNGYKIDGHDTLLPCAKEYVESIPVEDKILILTSRTDGVRVEITTNALPLIVGSIEFPWVLKFKVMPRCGKRESRRMKIEVKRVMPTRIALIGFKILSKAVNIED